MNFDIQVNENEFFVAFSERFSTFVWNGLFGAVHISQPASVHIDMHQFVIIIIIIIAEHRARNTLWIYIVN